MEDTRLDLREDDQYTVNIWVKCPLTMTVSWNRILIDNQSKIVHSKTIKNVHNFVDIYTNGGYW